MKFEDITDNLQDVIEYLEEQISTCNDNAISRYMYRFIQLKNYSISDLIEHKVIDIHSFHNKDDLDEYEIKVDELWYTWRRETFCINVCIDRQSIEDMENNKDIDFRTYKQYIINMFKNKISDKIQIYIHPLMLDNIN